MKLSLPCSPSVITGEPVASRRSIVFRNAAWQQIQFGARDASGAERFHSVNQLCRPRNTSDGLGWYHRSGPVHCASAIDGVSEGRARLPACYLGHAVPTTSREPARVTTTSRGRPSFSDMGDVCFCVQQPTLDAPEPPSYLPACAPVGLQGQGGSVTPLGGFR